MKNAIEQLKIVEVKDLFPENKQKLKHALFLPGRIDGVSLCVEFVYDWFIHKFGGEEKNFFKAINLDGSDPITQMSQWTLKDWVKRQRPKLQIIPKADIQFTNDNISDDYNTVIGYINRSRNKNIFFKDEDNGIMLGVTSRLNKIDFTFKIIVGQMAQQYDLFDYITMTCRVGKTLTLYGNMDFLVPTTLIRRLADDLHFELNERGMPSDPIKFLSYMNSHSHLTFLYKIRHITREYEFFVRFTDVMVHIRDIELDINDGNSIGMIKSDYGLEMRCSCRIPSPKFFVYLTRSEVMHKIIMNNDDSTTVLRYSPSIIPTKNANGWNIYVDGEFLMDNPNEILKLSIYDMFRESNKGNNNDLLDVIEHCRVKKISPEVFMDIKVFNDGKEREVYINWDTMQLFSRSPLPSIKSIIVVYLDLLYMNNVVTEIKDMYKNRIDKKEVRSY